MTLAHLTIAAPLTFTTRISSPFTFALSIALVSFAAGCSVSPPSRWDTTGSATGTSDPNAAPASGPTTSGTGSVTGTSAPSNGTPSAPGVIVQGDGGAGDAAGNAGPGASSEGGAAPPPQTRGASVPYWEYEAEDPSAATTTGTILPKSTTFGDVAAEASGRSAVKLQGAGQYVSFVLAHPTNSIVVRFSIPDAPSGGGQTATLGLYVNGVRQDLKLTSRYAWTYGDADAQGIGSENPAAGTPHHFYDEAHALFTEVPAGATIKLQEDAQDTAGSYVVDLVDFEDVAPPLPQPAGSLSITDYGATPDDGTDDSAAIKKAIADAQAQNKVLWIPRGTFDQPSNPGGLNFANTPKLLVSGVTIRGAGMWYSVLQGFGAQFEVSGNNNQFFDFAVFGDVTYRDDTEGWQGFDGPAGTGSWMENVWIEHETVGWWLGKGAFQGQVTQPLTNGLVIHGIRVRDTYADGVNMADATSNSTVEQSSFRNTGDDSVVTWSYASDGPTPCQGNKFEFNTVQTVWRANCFALYGGSDNTVENNTCADTSNYSGLFIATTGGFNVIPFGGTTTIARNTLTRAGGYHASYDYNGMGALKVFSDGKAINANISIEDILIDSPVLAGIQFSGSQSIGGVVFNGVTIQNYGTEGIAVDSGSNGSAELDAVVVTGSAGVGLKNDAAAAFTIKRGSGDVGF